MQKSRSSPNARPVSVLVVDDDPICRQLVIDALRMLGYQAHPATDGLEALALCQQRLPSLVLMDVHMPRLDGVAATERLLALQRDRTLPVFPIVGVTGLTSADDVDRCLAAGMTEVLAKPIELTRLAMVVGRHTTAPTVPSGAPQPLHGVHDEH